MLRHILDQIFQSLLFLFQSLNDKIAALNIELEEVKSVRDRFETDVGQTIQQLSDAKADLAELKSKIDELNGQIDEANTQNKVR